MNLRSCFTLFSLFVMLFSVSGQNLFRPPQPPSVTSKDLPEGLVSFRAMGPDESPASLISGQFAGMSQTSSIRPPDPHGAAGPNGVLQTVNLCVAYWNKSGGLIWGPFNLSSFFASVGNTGSGLSDPRVLYDRGAGRFYVIMQEAPSTQSFLNLAVSKNSHPATSGTADWYFYRLNTTEISGSSYGSDYPGLAFDGQAVYVTYNMYCLPFDTCGIFKNCQIVILNKAAITSGTGTYSIIYTADGSGNGFTLQPASVLGNNSPGNVAYFGETPLSSSTSVRIWALNDPLGSPTLTSTTVTVPNNGGSSGDAPQSGTSTTVNTLSNRTQGNAFWYNGAIWFCHTAGGSSGKSIVYYYKVNLNSWPASGSPTLAESGGINGGSGVWTYQPSIGANYRGDVGLVYCQSSTSTFPTIMYTARTASAGSFETPTLIKASPAYSNSDRWGDYASVTSDPTDESLWVTHEWSRSAVAHDWGTWWANIAFAANPILHVASSTLIGANGDQSVDPGECNDLTVVVRNDGLSTATMISATLTTSTPGVAVIQPNSSYPNIAPAASAANTTAFRISTGPSFVCGTAVSLSLILYYVGGASTNSFNLASSGTNYVITQSTSAAIVPGTSDVGNHGDDVTTTISLPFAYTFEGQTFSSATVSANGNIQFGSTSGAYANTCLPASAFTNTIFAFWDDLRTDGTLAPAQGIYTSISGVAPSRIFNVEWRASYYTSSANGNPVNFEVRLYESQSRFDVIYGAINGTGDSATVGEQKAAGSNYTEFECNAGGLSPGLQLAFQQGCTGAGVIYVDRSYQGTGTNGSICAPFKTVTDGYQAAQDGNAVRIFSGNYNEALLNMNKTLLLQATNGVVNIGIP